MAQESHYPPSFDHAHLRPIDRAGFLETVEDRRFRFEEIVSIKG